MSAVSHGTRHLRQGIGNIHSRHGPVPASRSIHIPTFTPRPNPRPSTAQRIFSETRTFFSRLVSHLTTPGLSHSVAVPPSPAHLRPAHFQSSGQTINARFSLPVRHALSRPFSAPRLPKPPTLPANVTQVGLGTARAFHSGRPIFQNIVDNVPIATRALWEAEWNIKIKKKEARKMRRATQDQVVRKTQEMLKPKQPIVLETIAEQSDASELDVYFPVEPTPAVTTHLLVPLAPTPTARLPLSSRTADSGAHPLLPISDIASIHTNHHLHSLRVSTLFARLDAASVWDDPGVNVDAYAFGPRAGYEDTREKQCTILRVTFRGWTADRVRAIIGHSSQEWYSLEETKLDGQPALVAEPEPRQDAQSIQIEKSKSPSLQSVDLDSTSASELELEDDSDETWDYGLGLSPQPMTASASAQHDLVLPTLDFSSSFTERAHPVPPPPQPEIFLRTVSELVRDAEAERWSSASSRSSLSSASSLLFSDSGAQEFPSQQSGGRTAEDSWDSLNLGLSSSFMRRLEEIGVNGW